MSANDNDGKTDDAFDHAGVEGNFDEVIAPEDIFPIKLGRPREKADVVDAKGDDPPPLPEKSCNVVLGPGFERIPAAAVLGFTEDDEELRHQPSEEPVHGTIESESVKAFFGSGTGADTVSSKQDKTSSLSFEYNMNHQYRGCFLIFNHMNFKRHLKLTPRNGTDIDGRNLTRTARKLGFEFVKVFDDFHKKDILRKVNEVANGDHSRCDCFAMAILTHGKEGDILYAKDAEYHIDEITEPFLATNCPSLAGKPKMFFLQSCRGETFDDGAEVEDLVVAKAAQVAFKVEKEVMIIPNAADFLLAHSTVPGYYAWRSPGSGSWFIQALCKCLEEFGENMELMQIMTRVNRMVAYDHISTTKRYPEYNGKKQIPSIVTRLTHEVFFRKKTKPLQNSKAMTAGETNEKVLKDKSKKKTFKETHV